MPQPRKPQLPTAAQLFELSKLAQKFADEIQRSPFDGLIGLWKPSELLPPDDAARVEEPVPLRKRRVVGLLGGYDADEINDVADTARRVRQEERHRVALQARFQVELEANAAHRKLKSSAHFRALRASFDDARKQAAESNPLKKPEAEAHFIYLLARTLAWFEANGKRARAATKEKRDQAAGLIDKLLALKKAGVSPPFVGLVSSASGARFVTLAEELERWRDELRAPPPAGRKRFPKNDNYLGMQEAERLFAESIKHIVDSPRVTAVLVERFDGLIGYKNPAARASR